MRWFFIPGIHLLNKLKLTAKFGIVALLFAIPVCSMGIWNLSADTAQINVALLQRDGLGALSLLRHFAEHVAQHRGQTNAYLGGEAHFKEKMQNTALAISQDLEALVNHYDAAAIELQAHSNLETLTNLWREIDQKALIRTATENFTVHTKLVKDILDTMKQVGDDAALSTESNLAMHYLLRTLMETLPTVAENLGLTRGMGSGRIAEGAISPEQRLRLTSLTSSVTESIDMLDTALEKAYEMMPELKSELDLALQNANTSSASFVKITEANLISAESFNIKADNYFGAGTQAINASFALYDATYKAVSSMIDNRVSHLRLMFIVTLVGMITLVGALAYLCVAFYLSIMGAVERLAHAASNLANGDFREPIAAQTRDEIALVAQSLDQLRARVAKRVFGILRSCELLVSRSEQMQHLALESREHVGSQMKDTDSLSTAITEMSVAIQEVAQTTVSAEETTTHVSNSVDEGGKTVNSMVQNITDLNNEMGRATTMISELEKRGGDINKILDVIQGIADQTNLLALNAAIEAARAGEQGRGFAVVADEVRTLAQRTQQSTLEIQQMIEQLQQGTQSAAAAIATSDTNAKAALQQAEKAGIAFLEIARQVSQLSTISSQCSVTTEEQARTANEIEERVGNLSERARDTTGAMIKSVVSNSSVSTLVSEVRVLLSAFSVDENTLNTAEDNVEDLFVWSDSLATGITEIDRQHKQIVRLVNELNVNVVLKRGNHAISRTLNALAQYTVNHFAFEEKIFEQTGYAEEEAHKIKHQKLLAKVQEYIKKVEGSDDEELYTQLMNFVRDWLVLHIQGDDKAYTEHMKSHGID